MENKSYTKQKTGHVQNGQADIGLISVIMAAYNAEQTIAQAIKSVLMQTYKNLELIIVDDCSTDDTISVISSFKDERIRLIRNEKNSGVSYTRQRAAKNANGRWIAVLDSDDAWANTKLELQANVQMETNASLLFTGSAFMNAYGEKIGWELHVPPEIDYRKLLKQNLISNSSVLVKKALYLKYINSDKNSDLAHEEFVCWLRMLKDGYIAYGIDQPLLIYRLSGNSKSGNKLKAAKMNWNTYRAVGLSFPASCYYMFWYTVNGLKKYKNLK